MHSHYSAAQLNAVCFTSAWTERGDKVRLRKGAAVFGGLEGVSLSLGRHLAWSGRAAEVKGRLALDAAAWRRADVVQAWKTKESNVRDGT